MRALVIWLTFLITATQALTAQGLPAGLMVFKGNCIQLIIGSEDLTAKCEKKLLHTAVNASNIDFYFSTTDERLFIFNGTDGDNPSPDTDFSSIKKVVFSKNGVNTDVPATGRCSYGNPNKGRSTVLCSGTLHDDRRFDAVFIIDIQASDSGPPQVSSSAPIPGSKPDRISNGEVEQGYSTDSPGRTFQPSDENDTFTLNICNKTNKDISIALYGKYNTNINDRNYVVTGWLIAPKKDCKSFPNFAKGDFAFYANDAAGNQWAGKDRRLCIEQGAFQRIYMENYTCHKSFVRGFTNIEINGDEYTLNLSR